MADPFGDPLDPQKIVNNLLNMGKTTSSPSSSKGKAGKTDPQWTIAGDPELNQAPPGTYKLIPPGQQAPGGPHGQPVPYQEYSYKGQAYDYTGKKQKGGINDPVPTGDPPPTQQSAPDAFTAGLGMFFAQYLAPMMNQINAQNQGLISQYGNAMNQALANPLPAGVAATMKPFLAQNEQLLALANNAGAQQVGWEIPFQNMVNQIGSYSQALQTANQILPQAAASQALASGNTQAIGQMLANMGLANTPYGAGILSLLSQPSILSQLTQGSKGSSQQQSGSSSQQSITPITVLPTQQAATTGTAAQSNPSNLANTMYAQQLANAMLTANQPNAASANALA